MLMTAEQLPEAWLLSSSLLIGGFKRLDGAGGRAGLNDTN